MLKTYNYGLLAHGYSTTCDLLDSLNRSRFELPIPVYDNDLQAKKRVLFAHIQQDSYSIIRQRYFVCLARQPNECID